MVIIKAYVISPMFYILDVLRRSRGVRIINASFTAFWRNVDDVKYMYTNQ